MKEKLRLYSMTDNILLGEVSTDSNEGPDLGEFGITYRGRLMMLYSPKMRSCFVHIYPGSAVRIFSKGQYFINGEDPGLYGFCPKCRMEWQRRTSRPKKCPICQTSLSKYTDDELSLEGIVVKKPGIEYVVSDETFESLAGKTGKMPMGERTKQLYRGLIAEIKKEAKKARTIGRTEVDEKENK